jgi:primosomal protein N' (replication factor Y)
MKIVTVIPFKKGPLKENLTYFTSKNIDIGDIVTISVRTQKILGMVVEMQDASENKSGIKDMNFNLKKILEINPNYLFKKEFIETAFTISDYFLISKNNIIATLLPKILENNYEKLNTLAKKNNVIQNINKIKAEKCLLQNSLQDRINIYKTLIRESFNKKQSIYITLPTEIGLNNFYKYLSVGIEDRTYLIHGGLSPVKQLQICQNILVNEKPILIIGSPAFLSLPRNDIQTIILENESSSAYKTLTNPSIDLRIFIEIFAKKNNYRFIMADNLLSFETINRRKDFIETYPMSFDIDFQGDIKIQNKKTIIAENENTIYKIFSNEIIKNIKNNIEDKKNVFIYSLRKGLATETICKDCKTSILCDECFAPIVLYSSLNGTKRIFVCNKCKKEKDTNINCPNCESWNLLPLGIGTETVYEEIKKHFPENIIYRIDKENTKTKTEVLRKINEYEEKNGAILIGTEMPLFYLNKKVDLAVIASFDSLWSIPNYKMSEKIIQLIISIASKTKNSLIIQTKNIQDNALLALQNNNIYHFIRKELEIRKQFNYPPFKRFIKIKHYDSKEDKIKVKNFLENYLREYSPDIFSAFIPKIKNQYITNCLVRLDKESWGVRDIEKDSSIDGTLLKKLNDLPNDFIIQTDPEDII